MFRCMFSSAFCRIKFFQVFLDFSAEVRVSGHINFSLCRLIYEDG